MPEHDSTGERLWHLPLDVAKYDCHPHLTPEEAQALARYLALPPTVTNSGEARHVRACLERLDRPLRAVTQLRTASRDGHRLTHVRKFLYRAMFREQRTFWAWSAAEWLRWLCPTAQAFFQAYPSQPFARVHLMDAAYLFGGVSDLRPIDHETQRYRMACVMFGTEAVHRSCQRIQEVLLGPHGFGYSAGPGSRNTVASRLALLFLLNRSPVLEDLTQAVLDQIAGDNKISRQIAQRIQDVLVHLHILTPPIVVSLPPSPSSRRYPQVAPAWQEWGHSWFRQATRGTLAHRRRVFETVMEAGLWLADTTPTCQSPADWDEEQALAYVEYLCHARIGQYAGPITQQALQTQGTLGAPLTPATIAHKLGGMRRFFTDLQDRPHQVGHHPPMKIPIRFKPDLALASPPAIKRALQPDPRDIDQAFWFKLTQAAATLVLPDLGPNLKYPLPYVRALSLLWVTSARRCNEIARLRVGCVRREWVPGMIAEDGTVIEPEEHMAYLHIPASKNRGPFWIWIPEYTAAAIMAWEQERPVRQPAQRDPKDGELVDFLFCYRNQRLHAPYINTGIIPLLCRKAGLPLADARGRVTSHRGRSTIATILRRRGVSLEEIAQYLGHLNTRTVVHYARTDPVQFARTLKKANDLERIVEGLIDPQAAREGKPSVFYFLGRGADGNPRYCGNPSWASCPHRMACLKCSMYIGATAAEVLEARDEVLAFQAKVPMTPEEQAASDGDIERLEEILAQKRELPLPSPPNATYHFPQEPELSEEGSPEPSPIQAPQESLQQRVATLTHDWEQTQERYGKRHVMSRALKRQVQQLEQELAKLPLEKHPFSED